MARSMGSWLLAVAVVQLAACGNDKMHEHRDASIDAAPPPYWQPKPGETKNWDIQITAPFDFTTPRAMMIVELFSSVPAATTLSYGDGSTVAVPAGANASAIATLAAAGAVVICRVGLGGAREGDPDYAKFPPAALSAMTLQDDPTAHFLDFAQRATWEDIAFERIDLAKQSGCDGIEPYLSDHEALDLGFTPDLELQRSWYTAVASAIHARTLSAGMRNGVTIGLIDSQVGNYDWLLVERCGENGDCELVKPFRDARKATFALDYTTDVDGMAQDAAMLCTKQTQGNVMDGLVKDVALTSAVRTQCQ